MKKDKKELDVDFIGGEGLLTPGEETAKSAFIIDDKQEKNLLQLSENKIR